MIGIKFIVTGLEEARKRLESQMPSTQRQAKFVGLVAQEIIDYWRATLPRDRDTMEHAADKFSFFTISTATSATATIVLPKKYKRLFFLDKGTKPHKIFGTPLSWKDKSTGERAFAMFVSHPGNKALNWKQAGIAKGVAAIQKYKWMVDGYSIK